jgi:hypothetical protein
MPLSQDSHIYLYKHRRRHRAFSSSKPIHPQQCSHGLHGYREHSRANHQKTLHEIVYPSYSSVGTRMPARNPVPLGLASIPKHARYINKFPLHIQTLSSRKAPARKDARSTPPGPEASSPTSCKKLHRQPAQAPIIPYGEGTRG